MKKIKCYAGLDFQTAICSDSRRTMAAHARCGAEAHSGFSVILYEAPSDTTSCTAEWQLLFHQKSGTNIYILTAFWDLPKGTRREI